MAKLIQSAEKSSLKPGVSDKALQKPVMAFVIQRHDLESLQLAMKLALRKAACRVFALQVRLIRKISTISTSCSDYATLSQCLMNFLLT